MKIDVTKPKFFQFNVTIEGIDYHALSGKLEFLYEDVIYAFPTKIFKDKVEVEIPPLQSIIKKHIQESDTIFAKLEITGEMFHLPAWKGEMEIVRSLFIESDDPDINDIPSKKKDKYENVLQEDVEFIRNLRNNIENDFSMPINDDVSNIENNEITESIKTKPNKKHNTKKSIKSFDKKKFLKEATKQETHAVKNNISFKETSKNDTEDQKEFRLKIRNIIQEGYIKKLKTNKKPVVSNDNNIPEINNETQLPTTSHVFDADSINENNIDKNSVRLMMESIGMKTEKTQLKMIDHAKDKGAKTEIEIFYSIKDMLYPKNQNNELQENYNKTMEVFSKSN